MPPSEAKNPYLDNEDFYNSNKFTITKFIGALQPGQILPKESLTNDVPVITSSMQSPSEKRNSTNRSLVAPVSILETDAHPDELRGA